MQAQAAMNVSNENMWVFPKIGVPQNGWFILENWKTLLKWMIWGYLFLETPMWFARNSSLLLGDELALLENA